MNPNILSALADNQGLFDAVKARVLEEFVLSTSFSEDRGDVELGQIYRARITGARLVEKAFEAISRHRTNAIPRKPENPAR